MTNGFELEDEAAFRKESLTRLRKALGRDGLRFAEQGSARKKGLLLGKTNLFLVDPQGDQIPAREGGPLLLLHQGKLQTYWLAVRVDIEHPKASTLLTHVTVQVRVGEATEPDKKLWLRAEWDTRKTDAGHAQPHWHIVLSTSQQLAAHDVAAAFGDGGLALDDAQALDAMEPEVALDGTEQGVAENFQEGYEWFQPLDDFHYAMSANWSAEKEVDAWSVPDSGRAVARWLERCIRYVRHQLDYCEQNIPARVRTSTHA